MPDLLKPLAGSNRLLFSVPLRPLQGDRFQPTGFPSLGAARYRTRDGEKLLVESTQSMANRLEATCWDVTNNAPVNALSGVSHVTVTRGGKFLTDSMLESHRINSPYIVSSSDRSFLDPFLTELRDSLGKHVVDDNAGLISRNGLAKCIFKFDIGSLIHGVFFASNKVKLEAGGKGTAIAGGRLRIARALSAFIEASGVEVAASGGVKNDHVHPGKAGGDLSELIGNVPFSRDEFVAERIDCLINLDLAQIRGYGLDQEAQDLLVLLALYRIRKLLDGDLRLRTACDLEPINRDAIVASQLSDFTLPALTELEEAVKKAVAACKDRMQHKTVKFEDELKKGKDQESDEADDADGDENE